MGSYPHLLLFWSHELGGFVLCTLEGCRKFEPVTLRPHVGVFLMSYNPITFIYKIVLSLVGNPQDIIIQGHSFDDMLGLIGSDGKVHVVTEPLVYTRGTAIE